MDRFDIWAFWTLRWSVLDMSVMSVGRFGCCCRRFGAC